MRKSEFMKESVEIMRATLDSILKGVGHRLEQSIAEGASDGVSAFATASTVALAVEIARLTAEVQLLARTTEALVTISERLVQIHALGESSC